METVVTKYKPQSFWRDCGRLLTNNLTILVVLFEMVLGLFILCKINYTEIDWSTYMQQSSKFLDGEWNYGSLTGDTGPLVYPAGHLYLYSILYYLTEQGKNIMKGQLIFLLVYIANLFLVLKIYEKTKIPKYFVLLLILSKRVRSIYLLRLFNDGLCMTVLHMSILICVSGYDPLLSAAVFSLALSIKMNALLFLPGFLLVYFVNCGLLRLVSCSAVIVLIQIILGMPFLKENSKEYLNSAFDFSRVFLYKWSVNFKFLPEAIFYSKIFSNTLILSHALLMLLFLTRYWSSLHDIRYRLFGGAKQKLKKYNTEETLVILSTSNLVGIIFARSLHYQFYSWYFYTIPLLLWKTKFNSFVKIVLFLPIEACWNIYPSNACSSAVLLFSHALIIFGLMCRFEGKRKMGTKLGQKPTLD